MLLVQILLSRNLMSWIAGIDHVFLDTGADPEKALVHLFTAKAHHVLDAGATARCSFRSITAADLSTAWNIAPSPLLKTRISFAGWYSWF